MKFTLEINCDGDDCGTADGLRETIIKTADAVFAHDSVFGFNRDLGRAFGIQDVNGNTVGKWTVTE